MSASALKVESVMGLVQRHRELNPTSDMKKVRHF
jgi:hypothetical protein